MPGPVQDRLPVPGSYDLDLTDIEAEPIRCEAQLTSIQYYNYKLHGTLLTHLVKFENIADLNDPLNSGPTRSCTSARAEAPMRTVSPDFTFKANEIPLKFGLGLNS